MKREIRWREAGGVVAAFVRRPSHANAREHGAGQHGKRGISARWHGHWAGFGLARPGREEEREKKKKEERRKTLRGKI
uniref:Uncharacterized protein P0406D01.111 n=1 Tax=Oryza sativa subsp. japonica TaxID=39947 RepID=Q69PQ3_ORYSJ|nr:hypothetical protein [Oryza sativa Japonica Group]